jgi:glycosyltransferase involved in cell wall biosynthesis
VPARASLKDVTVVVPTRNERANVPSFLASLPDEVELVVVDASADGTDEMVRRQRPRRTLVLRSPVGIPAARQLGAAAASGTWLLFTDADVRFEPGYFDRLVAHLEEDAVYGPKHATGAYPRYGRLFTAAQALLHRAGIPAASGSNMAVRSDVLARVGGFRLDLPVNEDTELMMRIRYRGFDVRWAPELGVVSLDDRRLRGGLAYKSAHNLARGLLLWLGLRLRLPAAWLASDWGYWSRSRTGGYPRVRPG